MTRLDGKVALVTGGSKGIGFAIASALLEIGARVAISGRRPDELGHARAKLAARSAEASVIDVHGDVGRADQASAMVAAAVQRFGGLDILVNNAGVGHFASIVDLSVDQWREIFDTNLSGVFYCSQAAIPHLRKRGGGWIINISSLASKNPFKGGGAYCASKAALNAFSEVLMQEVRYDNIRVSYVLPGSVRTGFTGPEPEGTDWKLTAEDVARVVVDLVGHDARSLPSRVELRPSRPGK
jgi:3-oxoacyl-[acyl-carrier protein] reductase